MCLLKSHRLIVIRHLLNTVIQGLHGIDTTKIGPFEAVKDTKRFHRRLPVQHSADKKRRIYNQSCKNRYTIKNSVVVNLSSRQLTVAELSMLNKGLGFVPATNIVDKTQLEKDIVRFERKLQIHHFFKNKDEDETIEKPMDIRRTMIPVSNWWPKNLNSSITEFCNDIKGEIMSLAKTKIHPNLTTKELQALKTLKKDSNIIIKPADKGGGIAVMNTIDYISKIDEMLNDELVYDKITKDDSTDVKIRADKLLSLLQEEGYISAKQLKFLTDFQPRTPLFYGLPKLHKANTPLRPVVSQINGPTSMVNLLVDKYLAVAESKIPNILQDTTAFLQLIDRYSVVEEGDFLVTMDVVGLYTNIPHEEGINWVTEFYTETLDYWHNEELKPIPPDWLAALMKFILNNCNFEFNSRLFKQKYGTTMGARFSVKFANIYMHKFFEKFFKQYIFLKPEFLGRLIDDVFTIWRKGESSLQLLLKKLNEFHNSIKFTMEYSQQEVHFLDTVIYIVDKRIHSKVYTKPTDKKQFLFFSSCHPQHVMRAIPYAQSIRYRRNTSLNAVFFESLETLKLQFLNRGYPKKLVQSEIDRCALLPRSATLSYRSEVEKKSKFELILKGRSFLPLIVIYHDQFRNAAISKIIKKYWFKLFNRNKALQNSFENEFPMVIFKRGKTLGSVLTSAKLNQKWINDNELAMLLSLINSGSELESS